MWFLVLLALVVASPAAAQTDDDTAVRPNAKPRFQADTVKFGPQLVRLFGIDAPDSVDYVDQQEEARIANRGAHAHECAPAWEWRAQQRAKRGP